MNLLKLFIPKDNAQQVAEIESWTVEWEVLERYSTQGHAYNKAFINRNEAVEFERQVKSSANFINAWIQTSLRKN